MCRIRRVVLFVIDGLCDFEDDSRFFLSIMCPHYAGQDAPPTGPETARRLG